MACGHHRLRAVHRRHAARTADIPGARVIYWLDLFGVAVFACSGALAAGQKRMDLFGAAVLAFVTAVGGGTLRDLVIGVSPVFWVRDPLYVWVALASGLAAFAVAHFRHPRSNLLMIADAFGLAVFTVVGTRIGVDQLGPGVIAAMTGVMSGVVGGIIRDVLVNRVPLVLRREIYASAALLGAITLQLLDAMQIPTPVPALIAGALVLALRLAALRWQLHLPAFPSRGH
ncbi:MAG: trimeric intracellular cation channel family protein [Chromatiaceae bacterium]|nr:trimeric intracellular cation channel family protein [Chromatiaceae bacterium]